MYDYNYGYDYNIDSTGMDIGGLLGGIAAFGLVTLIIGLGLGILLIVSFWKIFEKANRKGWESLVPIHNIFVLMEIAGTPTWHIFLVFLPIANIYVTFRLCIDLAHKFKKSTGFGVATVFFGIICFPILAFSKNAKYDSGEVEEKDDTNNNSTMNQSTVNYNQPTPSPQMMNNQAQVQNNGYISEQQTQNVEPATINPQPMNQPQLNINQQAQTLQMMDNQTQVQNTSYVPNEQNQNITQPTMNTQSVNPIPVQNNNNQNNTMM